MRRLEAKGTTIAYARTGAGPPIVLMPGADADHSMFARLSAQLDSGRTVLVCEKRYSGDTGPGQPSACEDLGHDAAALIKKLSIEKARIYGRSFRRLIAQLLAVHNPERAARMKNARQTAGRLYPEAHLAHPDVAWFCAPNHCRLLRRQSWEGAGCINTIKALRPGATSSFGSWEWHEGN